MGADVADLDRFDSDSEDAPVPAAAPPSAGASPSSPADAKGGGTSKAARLRAKKAAARAAQKARRREEKARFPPKRVDENSGSDEKDEDDENSGSLDEKDENGDENGDDEKTRIVAMRRRGSVRDRSADKTHHGVLNVEGVVVDGKLVLVDRKSKHVYSSTRRAHDGTHLRVGVWEPETGTARRLPRREVDAQRRAPPRKEALPFHSSNETPVNENDDHDDETHESSARMEAPPSEITHAFEVDPDDHCETSPEAHGNVINFLAKIAERVGKRPSDLVIYDPYYCAGGTKRSFATLGFKNVINPNEDFYDVLARDAVPTHDVLITNPPYSADHVERCLTFAAENLEKHARPYFLLLPSYVVNKPYYVDALLTGGARGRAWRERNDAKAEKAEKAERTIRNEKSDSDSETTSDSDSVSDSEIARSDAAADAAGDDAMKIHSPTPKTSRGTLKIRDVRSSRAGSSSSRKQTLPFYVAPSKRYYYWTPKALASSRRRGLGGDDIISAAERKKRKRGHVGRLGERTSPFPSFWYCGLGEGFQTEALRWHRKLPRAMVDGYAVASHPNDLPLHVLDEWDPRREKLMAAARDGESSWRNGGMSGRARKPPPRRFAGFSGANCGQNMPAKDKKRYAEFAADAPRTREHREGAMFARPRRKNKY